MSDRLQHRKVRGGIRVGVAGGEVVAVLLSQLAHDLHFALAVAEGARERARVQTVVVAGGRGAGAMGEAGFMREAGHDLGGAGREHQAVLAAGGVLGERRLELRAQRLDERRQEHVAKGLDVAGWVALDGPQDAVAYLRRAFVGGAAEKE